MRHEKHRRWIRITGIGLAGLLGLGAVVALVSDPPELRHDAPSRAATGAAVGRAVADAVAGSGRAGSAPDGGPASIAVGEPVPGSGSSTPGLPSAPSRVVKTAALDLSVPRTRSDRTYDAVLDTVAAAGGFVASSNRADGGARLTLRVPAERFETVLASLKRLGKVRSVTVQGEDVTAAFVDLEGRLRNARAQEAVLLDLMAKARSVPDSITVQQQLAAIQGQIEEIEGRRRLLDDQAGLGTITVSIGRTGAPAPGEPAREGVLARSWRQAVGAGLAVVGGTLVLLGALVPLAILAGLVAVPAVVVVRRRRLAATG